MRLDKLIKFLSVLCTIIILVSCSKETEVKSSLPTIKPTPNSNYSKTFKELSLGQLLDFNLRIPHANERWVELWVDRYVDGVKEEDPFINLSYGLHPNETSEGHIGFGLINPDAEFSIPIIYAPGLKTNSNPVKLHEGGRKISTWMYALDEKKKTKIELNKIVTLGIYREVAGNTIQSADIRDKEELKRIIQEDHQVLVLRLKITKNKE